MMQNLWLWGVCTRVLMEATLWIRWKSSISGWSVNIPATSLLSSATNIQKELYTSHSLLWILLICYLPFQQRSTEFLNYIARIKLCDIQKSSPPWVQFKTGAGEDEFTTCPGRTCGEGGWHVQHVKSKHL